MNNDFFAENMRNLEDKDRFSELDPHLIALTSLKYVNFPEQIKQFPLHHQGICTLTGGGLTGKTTLLKQWIAELLHEESQNQIYFFTGKTIHNFRELTHLLEKNLITKNCNVIAYLFIDDVTDVHEWWKALQIINKKDLLKNVILVLTSGDITLSEKILKYLPDLAKNRKENINIHLTPLSFHETIELKYPTIPVENVDLLFEFDQYLFHGGYLPAINDMAKNKKVSDSTLKMYIDWLKKEVIKHGKQESFAREILASIINHYNKPTTWNFLAKELSINHPKTIAEYLILLERLDTTFVQSALLEKTLLAAPKKARKLLFNDPFIFHAIRAWINPCEHLFERQMKPALANADLCSCIVHGCATTHYKRYYPTFYIKSSGEIDIVCLKGNSFKPMLVIWNNELRSKDLKQLMKYQSGKILTKTMQSSVIEHIRTEPLPRALMKLKKY